MIEPVAAEWRPHRAMWLGFPSHPDLWGEDLEPARRETAALALALAGPGGETVKLLVSGEETRRAALSQVGSGGGVEVIETQFGDIWFRDTGPIFHSAAKASAFAFNGWGGKYVLAGDAGVTARLGALSGAELTGHDFVLEGGALDHDGGGTAITTRQCLLNPNRNPGWSEAVAERSLARALGVRKTIWLGEGLANDHTDGHVDNLARFVAPGLVVCQTGIGGDDPNAEVHDIAARALGEATDARGCELRVVRIPSPGRVLDRDGRPAPASHMNFLIANRAVIMPSYETRSSRPALEALQMLFADREVVALDSRALLTGGGSFHCISQQQPA